MRNVWQSEIDALALRQEKRIITLKAEPYQLGFPPTQLQEFILWANSLTDEIPEEYLSTAEIVIGAHHEYDDIDADIQVSYRRPETDEEWDARKQGVMTRMQAEQQRELNLLAQLQAKYGA